MLRWFGIFVWLIDVACGYLYIGTKNIASLCASLSIMLAILHVDDVMILFQVQTLLAVGMQYCWYVDIYDAISCGTFCDYAAIIRIFHSVLLYFYAETCNSQASRQLFVAEMFLILCCKIHFMSSHNVDQASRYKFVSQMLSKCKFLSSVDGNRKVSSFALIIIFSCISINFRQNIASPCTSLYIVQVMQ